MSPNVNLYLLGSILGWSGFLLLYAQFVIGSRFVTRLFTKDFIRINKLHQKLGKFGIVLILAHPAVQVILYGSDLLLIIPKNSFELGLTFGKLALVLFLVIWITSAVLRSRILHRPWLYTHYISYPLLFFVFIHARQIGTLYNSVPVLTYSMNTLFFIYGVIVLYRLINFIGVGNYRFRLIDKSGVGNDVTVYRFKSLKHRLVIKPGQFLYLQLHPMGESHPFSCMEVGASGEHVTLGIKSVGKFTCKLADLALGNTVRFDGPYGVFTREGHNLNPKVFVAGGIGITPFVEVIKRFGNNKTYLFYSNRTLNGALYRDKLTRLLGNNYFDIITKEDVRGTNIIRSKLTPDVFNTLLPEEFRKSANFFICGSAGFYAYYRGLLENSGVAPTKIFYEKFGL